MSRRSKANTPSAVATLQLPPELTIYTVGELQPQWLGWLGQAGAAAGEVAPVHAAGLGEVDAAGLQMLLSLERAVAERGRRLHIQAPSPALRACCAAAGLGDWLEAHSAEEQAA